MLVGPSSIGLPPIRAALGVILLIWVHCLTCVMFAPLCKSSCHHSSLHASKLTSGHMFGLPLLSSATYTHHATHMCYIPCVYCAIYAHRVASSFITFSTPWRVQCPCWEGVKVLEYLVFKLAKVLFGCHVAAFVISLSH